MSKKIKVIWIIACLVLIVYPFVIQPYLEYGSIRIKGMVLAAAFIGYAILSKEKD